MVLLAVTITAVYANTFIRDEVFATEEGKILLPIFVNRQKIALLLCVFNCYWFFFVFLFFCLFVCCCCFFQREKMPWPKLSMKPRLRLRLGSRQ